MPLLDVNVGTLSMLNDGYLGRCVNEAFEKISKDLDERGSDGLKRKLIIELTFTPDGPEKAGKRNIAIDSRVDTKLPSSKPPAMVAKLDHRHGGMTFRDDSPMEPDQTTFADVEGEQQ